MNKAILVAIVILLATAFTIAPSIVFSQCYVDYNGNRLPEESVPKWERVQTGTGTAHADGILEIDTTSGDYAWYYYIDACFDNSKGLKVEFALQITSYPTPVFWDEVLLAVCDGTKTAHLTLRPDRIMEGSSGLYCDMDTTDKMHVYLLEAKGNDFKVYVDWVLQIDGTGKYTTTTTENRVYFGDICHGAGGGGAISRWDYIRWGLPVGGINIPVDKLALLAPYIALAAAFVAVTVGAAYGRKRWLVPRL